jgi:hypothetical protein
MKNTTQDGKQTDQTQNVKLNELLMVYKLPVLPHTWQKQYDIFINENAILNNLSKMHVNNVIMLCKNNTSGVA